MTYKLVGNQSITFTTDDGKEGSGTYSFNEDYTKLTLVQTGDDGKDETTEFQKVSEDTVAEPSSSKK